MSFICVTSTLDRTKTTDIGLHQRNTNGHIYSLHQIYYTPHFTFISVM
jgi:hypothetical protein